MSGRCNMTVASTRRDPTVTCFHHPRQFHALLPSMHALDTVMARAIQNAVASSSRPTQSNGRGRPPLSDLDSDEERTSKSVRANGSNGHADSNDSEDDDEDYEGFTVDTFQDLPLDRAAVNSSEVSLLL